MAESDGSMVIHHPLYDHWLQTWTAALDVYEGSGGFLSPERPYIMPHPREWLDHSIKSADPSTGAVGVRPNPNPSNPSPKLIARRKIARYENLASTIMDTVIGALFEKAPARTFKTSEGNPTVMDWYEDVDGKGTTIDAFMRDSWLVAGVFSHAVLFLDKAPTAAGTKADQALPRLYRYTPLDVIDWLEDEDQKVIAVKLLEPAPRESFAQRMTPDDLRVRVVDEEQWTLYDKDGKQLDQAAHGMGRLPIVFLYAKRRVLTPVIGKSVMGDPTLYIDLYNLISEVRELLRNQTFGILNVPIGVHEGASVEREQNLLGAQSGTSNVLFSTQAAQYLSPEGTNVAVYHEHMDRLARMIYRLASAPYESDSKDAEAVGSLKLKRQDLQNTLSSYANELQQADEEVLELVYRAIDGPDRWEKSMERDEAAISYPDSFEDPDFEIVAKVAKEMIGMELGDTAAKEIKKRTAFAYLPNISPEMKADITKEIDALAVETEADKRQALLEATAMRVGGGGPKPPRMPKPDAA